MWDVSLSQCGSWECKSSWMWDWVGVWVATTVSKECSALTFTVKRFRTACLLKMKALWSFSVSGTSNPCHSIIFQKMWIPIATLVCMITERPCHRTGTSEPSYHRGRVQTQGNPRGFILNKFIMGQVFLWDSVVFIPPILLAFPSSEAGVTGHRTKELKSHCYIQIKLCRNCPYSAESGDSLADKKKKKPTSSGSNSVLINKTYFPTTHLQFDFPDSLFNSCLQKMILFEWMIVHTAGLFVPVPSGWQNRWVQSTFWLDVMTEKSKLRLKPFRMLHYIDS